MRMRMVVVVIMIKAILMIWAKSLIIRVEMIRTKCQKNWAGQNSKWQQRNPEKYQQIVWYFICWHFVLPLFVMECRLGFSLLSSFQITQSWFTGDEGAWWGQAAGVLARGQPRRVCDQHRGEQDWNFCDFKRKDIFCEYRDKFPPTYIHAFPPRHCGPWETSCFKRRLESSR